MHQHSARKKKVDFFSDRAGGWPQKKKRRPGLHLVNPVTPAPLDWGRETEREGGRKEGGKEGGAKKKQNLHQLWGTRTTAVHVKLHDRLDFASSALSACGSSCTEFAMNKNENGLFAQTCFEQNSAICCWAGKCLNFDFLFICKFSRWHRCVLMSCGWHATAPYFCFASHQRHRGNMTCYIDHPPIQDIRLQNVWNNLLAQIRSTELKFHNSTTPICHKQSPAIGQA